MGKVRVRPETGKLYFDFNYLGERCREYTALKDTDGNRKKMQTVLNKIEAEIELGILNYERYFPQSRILQKIQLIDKNRSDLIEIHNRIKLGLTPRVPTVREFSVVWFAENEVRWRRATRTFMQSHLNRYVLEEFGERMVNEITRADILAFRTKLAKVKPRNSDTTLSPRTINAYMTVLKTLLNEAADRFQFTAPTARLPSLRIPRTEIEPFTLEEVFKVIQAVPEDYRHYVTVRFFTGMRTAEADGLKWKRIDWTRKQIGIAETYSSGNTDFTKNDSSKRHIDMNGLVYDALIAQKNLTGAFSEYVFCNSAGGPLDSTNFNKRIWLPTLKKLGLQPRRPYQMRHTAATLWLASGEAPEWIAKQMGHSSTQMLFKVYSRYVPNLTRKDGAAFEQMMAANGFIKTVHHPVQGGEE